MEVRKLMTKLAGILTFITGFVVSLVIVGSALAQTTTTSPTTTTAPTGVVPTSAPATGRG